MKLLQLNAKLRRLSILLCILASLAGSRVAVALEVFSDSERRLTYQEVRALPDSDFAYNQTGYLGFSSARFWVRMTLENLADKPVSRLIHFEEAMQRSVTAYFDVNGVTRTLQNGFEIPVSERQISTAHIVFEIELPARSSQTVYFAIEGDTALTAEHRVYDEAEWLERYQSLLIVASAMLASYLVLILYNGFLAVSTKDIVYRYYLLVLTGAFVALCSKYAIPAHSVSLSGFTAYIHSLGGVIAYGATPLFLRSVFAELNSAAIRFISNASLISVMLFIPVMLIDNAWTLKIYSQYWIGLLLVLFWWGILAVAIKHRHPLWKVITIGWTPVTVGTALYVAYLNGWLPASFATAGETSSLYEAFVFSIALAYRLKIKDQQISAAAARLELQAEHIVEIKRHEAELEQLVSDRTAHLSAALEELQERRARQAQMLSVISHELRTPLSSSHMIYDKLTSTNLDKYLPVLRANSEDALAIMDDLRMVTQPDAQATKDEAVDIPSLVIESTLSSLSHLAQKYSVAIHYSFDELVAEECLFSRSALRQIVTNLVKNAYLHSEAANLWVSANAKPCSSGLTELTVCVEDDGKGISEAFQQKMYDAFSRDETRSAGTGLGLYIVKKLAESLNGEIAYFNSRKGGAGFKLKALLAPAFVRSAAKDPIYTEEQLAQTLSNKTILLVDDDNFILSMTAEVLTAEGAKVRIAPDGQRALSLFSNSSTDIVLTDAMMPEMDGYELCERLREVDFRGPIIAVTAATIGNERDRLITAGADAVLSKPLNIDELKLAIAGCEQNRGPA